MDRQHSARGRTAAGQTRRGRPALPRPLLPLWAAVIAAAGAGLLMDTAFPELGIWIAAFPAAALLLLALIGRSIGGALLVGLVYGGVFFFLLVSWTARYLGPIPWAGLAGLEAVLTAVLVVPIALAYRWMPRVLPGVLSRLIALPALVAALWVLREQVLGTWPYGGFPWARIAMSQSESPLAPVTSWTGVTGLSFLVVFVVAMVIEAIRLGRIRRPVTIILPIGLIAALVLLPSFPTAPAGTMRIAAVQGNGPTGYFDQREPYAVIEAQLAATEPVLDEDLDLVVWPEGALDADPFRNERIARSLTRLVRSADAPVLVNTATVRDVEGEELIFNTSLLWTADAAADPAGVQIHDKRHPVPFGEYVPDRPFFAALAPDLIGLLQREYTAGSNPPVIDVDGVTLGLAICFDVIYDDVLVEGIRAGAEALVFQTNNADFRETDENLQQLALARMRAIETGRSVVNVSTVGTSQIIRPDGSTVAALGAGEAGALVEDVALRTGATGGVIVGPGISAALPWAGLAGLVIAGIAARVHRSR